jgi:type II secretory ATPase GspE/PulE/Tfp pilus assembly ATPase PilB-like protein
MAKIDQPESDIIKAVNDIIAKAIEQSASDIHFEPQSEELIVRYRLDGILRIVFKAPLSMRQLIVSRIKVMCQLDTTGLPRPQEGNIKFVVNDKRVDLRVSILPTCYGECVVMRVLESVSVYQEVEDLGFTPEQAALVKNTIKKPYGLVLVTGPTGSGKSTTLFSLLDRLNEPGKCMVTLEDPVERKVDMVRQTQINPDMGLTFASGLRYMLRQDPDVVMVGEIRDRETAQISVQAAITGQLVLSTVHTNGAAGAVIRLIDMGVEPFLLSSALQFVTAQRLARVNCPNCIEAYKPSSELAKLLGIPEDSGLYRSKGCDACNFKGFKGRIGIHEVLPITKEIEELILTSPSDDQIALLAKQAGMMTLREAAVRKALEGVISAEEVIRLTE